MSKIETGNFVKYIGEHTVYKVADVIPTQSGDYCVLIDNFGFAVDTVKSKLLLKVNVKVETVEVWREI